MPYTPGPWRADDEAIEFHQAIGLSVWRRLLRVFTHPNSGVESVPVWKRVTYLDQWQNERWKEIPVAWVGPYLYTEDPRADARLVAAAPDLLAACLEFVGKVERGEARRGSSYAPMKAAIGKAIGEL